MAATEWKIEGYDFSACNCAWGCPCQFNALPTHGNCEAGVAIHVVRGNFGGLKLDGLTFGGLFKWPGPIHLGNGEALPVVDERASREQRDALLKIMSGQDTDPGATFFQVFFSMLSKVHDPIFTQVDLAFDLAKGMATASFKGVADFSAKPIANPMTGAPHRARVSLPEGFEFAEAEFASSRIVTEHHSPISLEWDGRHAHLAKLHITGHGIVRH